MSINTTVIEQKQRQLKQFIEQVLAPETAVIGVVGIGAVVDGQVQPDSDINFVAFLNPLDHFIVPAEAIWQPENNTFYSIYDDTVEGIAFNCLRLDWSEWQNEAFVWPEAMKAELQQGWIAYDPNKRLAQLIASRIHYREDIRLARLDDSLIQLDSYLAENKPEKSWQIMGPLLAHARLHTAYDYLIQALFAYNRCWRPQRNRETAMLLTLSWIPSDFVDQCLIAMNAPALDYEGYMTRVNILQTLFKKLIEALINSGDYSYTPVDQALIRRLDEPGRSWNLSEWNKFRRVRALSQ